MPARICGKHNGPAKFDVVCALRAGRGRSGRERGHATVHDFIAAGGPALDKLTLSLLNKEVARLRALIGIDAENAKAFARLSEKIPRDEAALAKLDRDIKSANQAEERIKALIRSDGSRR